MTANNEEGPTVQGEAFEITNPLSEEQTVNDTIIPGTTDNRETRVDFSRVPRPGWVTSECDLGLSPEDAPMWGWIQELEVVPDLPAAVEQVLTYRPETRDVTIDAPFLSVWVNGNDAVRITDPVEAVQLARVLLAGAEALRTIANADDARIES